MRRFLAHLRRSGTKELALERAIAVGEIAAGHTLLTFELDFVDFKRSLLTAANDQKSVEADDFRRAQACGHRIDGDHLRGPDVKIFPAKRGKCARPWLEAAQSVADLSRIAMEVDSAVFLLKNRRKRSPRVILGNGADLVSGQLSERFDQESCPEAGECGSKGLRGIVRTDRQFALRQYVAGIEAGVDSHDGHSGDRLTFGDGPLKRGSPAVLGQQRCMNVQIAVRRQVDHPLGDDAPVAYDDDGIGIDRLELRLKFGIVLDALRLRDFKASGQRALFHRRGRDFHAPAARLIRLRDYKRHMVSSVGKSLEGGDGKTWSTGEDEV